MIFIGSVLSGFRAQKKLIFGPSIPPERGHFGPFYTQNGQNGIQKRSKNTFFEKMLLPQVILFRFPDGFPVDLILAHFVCKKSKFGVKNYVFLKYVFSYKMTFLRSSDQFSLGSQWCWYLQNDKMYTLGPIERPSGVKNGPRRAKNGPQNPTWPIWPYFGLFFLAPGSKFV